MEAKKNPVDKPDSPPFGKSWKNLYAIVFGELVLLILFFYFFTQVFE
jgi:hypothetical protein